MTTGEIKANYLDIYRDISKLKETVKIPHPNIKNIVYTIDHGTMDWIRDFNFILLVDKRAKIYGIYRLTLISVHQFNIIVDGKTHSGGTATVIIGDHKKNFNIVAVDSSIIRSPIIWCLELVNNFLNFPRTP